MQDAGYVIAGWALTGALLLGYAANLGRRRRRAAATLRRAPGADGRSR